MSKIDWSKYEVEGGRRYVYAPSESNAPTFNVEQLLEKVAEQDKVLEAYERAILDADELIRQALKEDLMAKLNAQGSLSDKTITKAENWHSAPAMRELGEREGE